jgi:hypothetical protein
MDALSNPYTPNAGAKPPLLVGRDDQLESFRVLLARLERGRTEQSMVITGLRGVGKTVLLGAFRQQALTAHWVVIEFEVHRHSDDEFRRRMALEVRRALLELSPRERRGTALRTAARVLRSFTVSIDPDGRLTVGLEPESEPGRADSEDLALDLPDLLVALGEAAAEAGRGVVLLLDEIQFLGRPQLEALIMAIHKTVQRALPITFVGAGLPQMAELAGEAKSYSERLFKFPAIGELGENDSARALVGPAEEEGAVFDADAIALAHEITGGYPYFVQELGSAVWPIATASRVHRDDVEAAQISYEEKLDSSFFRVRLDRTTDLERAYLRAMAALGPEPQSAADVARLLDRTSQQCGPIRSQLIDKGLLWTPSFGFAAFTMPHFDRFMLRAVPALVVPPVRPRS